MKDYTKIDKSAFERFIRENPAPEGKVIIDIEGGDSVGWGEIAKAKQQKSWVAAVREIALQGWVDEYHIQLLSNQRSCVCGQHHERLLRSAYVGGLIGRWFLPDDKVKEKRLFSMGRFILEVVKREPPTAYGMPFRH